MAISFFLAFTFDTFPFFVLSWLVGEKFTINTSGLEISFARRMVVFIAFDTAGVDSINFLSGVTSHVTVLDFHDFFTCILLTVWNMFRRSGELRDDRGTNVVSLALKVTSSIPAVACTAPESLTGIPPGLISAILPVLAFTGFKPFDPNSVYTDGSLRSWRVAFVTSQETFTFD